jgi:hypothetical protein
LVFGDFLVSATVFVFDFAFSFLAASNLPQRMIELVPVHACWRTWNRERAVRDGAAEYGAWLVLAASNSVPGSLFHQGRPGSLAMPQGWEQGQTPLNRAGEWSGIGAVKKALDLWVSSGQQ